MSKNSNRNGEGVLICGACAVSIDSRGEDTWSVNMIANAVKGLFSKARHNEVSARTASRAA